jgi:transcriptional regulator with XRE-family HTH domain
MTTIGEKIKIARLNANLTQAKLAWRLGTKEHVINSVEINRIDPGENISLFAKALNVNELSLANEKNLIRFIKKNALFKDTEIDLYTVDQHNRMRRKLLQMMIFLLKQKKTIVRKNDLFEYLYNCDFEMYHNHKHSITGLSYYAWRDVVCPEALLDELDHPEFDLDNIVNIHSDEHGKYVTLKDGISFNKSYFTDDELIIMNKFLNPKEDTQADKFHEHYLNYFYKETRSYIKYSLTELYSL